MKANRSAWPVLLMVLVSTGTVGAQSHPRAASSPTATTVCSLLEPAEIKKIQNAVVEERKASEQAMGTLKTSQCFYRTKNFIDSVSLAWTAPSKDKPEAARDYWKQKISAAAASPLPEKPMSKAETKQVKHHPKLVAGLGDEAWWMGDRKAGALYVLYGNDFLRISVGGAGDEEQKKERSKLLAQLALKRLPKR